MAQPADHFRGDFDVFIQWSRSSLLEQRLEEIGAKRLTGQSVIQDLQGLQSLMHTDIFVFLLYLFQSPPLEDTLGPFSVEEEDLKRLQRWQREYWYLEGSFLEVEQMNDNLMNVWQTFRLKPFEAVPKGMIFDWSLMNAEGTEIFRSVDTPESTLRLVVSMLKRFARYADRLATAVPEGHLRSIPSLFAEAKASIDMASKSFESQSAKETD